MVTRYIQLVALNAPSLIDPVVERGIVVYRHFGHELDIRGVRKKALYQPLHSHGDTNIKVYCSSFVSTCLKCHIQLIMREAPFHQRQLEFVMGELVLRDYELTKVDTDLHHKYPELVCPRLRNFL